MTALVTPTPTPTPIPTPTLGRFVLLAILMAIAVHILVLGAFLFSSRSDGGGGGQVLGHLSVSLGGTGAAGSSEMVEVETVLETPATPSKPRIERLRAQPPEVPAQKSQEAAADPIHRQSAETPIVSEPIEETLGESLTMGGPGDGNPVGARRAGSQSLGEGVAADRAGMGATDAVPGDQRDAYLALIRARIEKNRTYPSVARRRREEGMVMMQISIDGHGRLSGAEIVTGSGSFHLDRAAKRMVEKSVPFPPPPITPFSTTIPIVFALR